MGNDRPLSKMERKMVMSKDAEDIVKMWEELKNPPKSPLADFIRSLEKIKPVTRAPVKKATPKKKK